MSKKTLHKRTLIIFTSLLASVFIGWQLFKELKVKAFVVNSIQSELNHYFEDSISFEVQNIRFQVLKKKFTLEKVKVFLRTNENDTIAKLEIPFIYFTWNKYWETFNQGYFKFESLDIEKAKLLLPIDFEKLKNSKASRPSFDGRFELELSNFNITDGEIIFYDRKGKKHGSVSSHYDLKASHLYFQKNKTLTSFKDIAEKIEIEFKKLTYHLKDKIHRLDVENISLDVIHQSITLRSVRYRPIYTPKKFAKIMIEQSNHIDLYLDSVRLTNVNWAGDSLIAIENIYSKDIKLKVTKDKNYPLPESRYIPILVNLLKNSSTIIDVRKCNIENFDLHYHEIPNGKNELAKVYISNIDLAINNITNHADSLLKYGHFLHINANGQFYNEGKLKSTIKYDLNSNYGYFEVSGKLEPMNLNAINQYLTVSYPVAITSGRLDDLYFNYSGGNKAVSGEMELRYSDLNIRFYKILNEEEKGDKALSWLANVALAQNNPRKNGRFRVGKIKFKRDTRKSMFSYWSNSLISGFQSTIGLEKPARIEKLEPHNQEDNLWEKIGLGKEVESE